MSEKSVDELIDEMKRMIVKIGTAEEKKKIEEEFRTLEEEAGKSDDVETFTQKTTNLKKKVKRMVDETKKKDDKISSLRGKIDQLSNGSKAEGGQKAGSKRKNADDSEDDDDKEWDY